MTRQDLAAVVIVAHGDRGGDAPNASLLAHRDALAAAGTFRTVTAGVLKGEPALETALVAAQDSAPSRILIYPLFMADGYFTRQILPQRIADVADVRAPVTILPPLGSDPRLPGLMLCEALNAAVQAGFEPRDTRLLVVGHGSQLGPASANATRAVAAAMARMSAFAHIGTAFLEEPEFVADALVADPRPTIVSGFFSGDGLHAAEDVPEAIAESGKGAVYAGSIGRSPDLVRLIAGAIEDTLRSGERS